MSNLGILGKKMGTKMPDFGILKDKNDDFGVLKEEIEAKMPDFGIFGDKNAQFWGFVGKNSDKNVRF